MWATQPGGAPSASSCRQFLHLFPVPRFQRRHVRNLSPQFHPLRPFPAHPGTAGQVRRDFVLLWRICKPHPFFPRYPSAVLGSPIRAGSLLLRVCPSVRQAEACATLRSLLEPARDATAFSPLSSGGDRPKPILRLRHKFRWTGFESVFQTGLKLVLRCESC